METVHTDTSNEDFVELISDLDAELNKRYGSKQSNYDKHNKIDPIDTAIVGYLNGKAVACGCFKQIAANTIEIKRMYVDPHHRRNGFSQKVLNELEKWASKLGYLEALLETGKGQPEAIALYKKCGYQIIENYGPYKGLENSVCMKKII